MDSKYCPGCKRDLPMSEYYTNKSNSTGYQSRCKECMKIATMKWRNSGGRFKETQKRYLKENKEKVRNGHLKRRFGISLEDYQNILEQQNFKCAICRSENARSKFNTFAVDHNHKTGKVRGLLCQFCNSAIGYLQDSSSICINAAQYLEKYNVK